MNKKSQAALEFLTTYAWAFLVILIMISALAYFGILRPSRLLPDRCNFGSQISCVDYKIAYGTGADGTFSPRLKKNVRKPIFLKRKEGYWGAKVARVGQQPAGPQYAEIRQSAYHYKNDKKSPRIGCQELQSCLGFFIHFMPLFVFLFCY